MSEVNYRRNGLKYSTSGKCWGVPNKKATAETPRPKATSSRERRALRKSR